MGSRRSFSSHSQKGGRIMIETEVLTGGELFIKNETKEELIGIKKKICNQANKMASLKNKILVLKNELKQLELSLTTNQKKYKFSIEKLKEEGFLLESFAPRTLEREIQELVLEIEDLLDATEINFSLELKKQLLLEASRKQTVS
jgi:hypothetical protein